MTLEVDGNVSVVPLPGGHQTAISGLGIYSPDDSKTQRCGVRIDPPIFPTPEGALAGRDEVLERALQPASAQFPDGRPFAAPPTHRGGRNCFSTSHPHHLFHLSRITPNRNYRAHSAGNPPLFPPTAPVSLTDRMHAIDRALLSNRNTHNYLYRIFIYTQ